MLREKKSDMGYDNKYKMKVKVMQVLFTNPDKYKKEYKVGVVGGCLVLLKIK